jgi:hypothetical protein
MRYVHPLPSALHPLVVRFPSGAEQYADQLDPLSTVRSNPDQQRERSYYGSSGESLLKQLLLRLSGCDNKMHWKRPLLSADASHAAD